MSWFTLKRLPGFQYAPLDPSKRAFRLVQLLATDALGMLRIEIIETNADAPIPYDALSYAWSVPPHAKAPNRQIIVETKDGPRILFIHQPLEVALLHLVANNTAHKVLFIDQIGINQKDNPEKSHQVDLMRDIYAKCAHTIVWLGPSTRASEQFFNYVHEICHEGVLSRVMGPRLSDLMYVFEAVMDPSLEVNGEQREDRDDLLRMIRQYGDRFPLDGYADALDRRWFNRLWIVQEACLAPAVVFICGNQSLCFDCFRAGALFYNLYNTHWVKERQEATSQQEYRKRNAIFGKTAGLVRIFQERKAIHQSEKRQGLYDIVLKYNINNDEQKIQASLAEDRIFGLMGLTAVDDKLRHRVRVRYENDVTQIYAEVAALLMEENVDTLLFSQFPKQTVALGSQAQQLPSWAPNWAMDLKIPVGYSSLKEPIFAAGGSREGARFEFDATSRRLTVRGVFVDQITHVGNRTYRADLEPQVTEQIDYRWLKLFFDEVAEFVREAALTRDRGNPSASGEVTQGQRPLQLCDSGLSYKYFTAKLGDPAGVERLRALHGTLSQLGQRLLQADETVASYHITRVYQTVGITPWYFLPFSETNSLRRCALNPVSAGKVLWEALQDFIMDMVGLVVASARVSLAAYRIKFRQRFSKIDFHAARERGEQVGLDPNVSFGSDMSAFIENLLKNKGRRLYRTETGLVGVGPAQMERGDSVVVFHGGTVPHVLRKTQDIKAGSNEVWNYLGESYCDGIMGGEALEAGFGSEQSFCLS